MKASWPSQFLITIALTISMTVLGVHLFAQPSGSHRAHPRMTNNELPQSTLARCLPTDVKLNDVVQTSKLGDANGQPAQVHKVTVEQKLNELKAVCNRDNKLIDGDGKQIVFYHLIGCWGNPPADYQELLEKQREEVNKLKQQYTVIEMTCNPSGVSIS